MILEAEGSRGLPFTSKPWASESGAKDQSKPKSPTASLDRTTDTRRLTSHQNTANLSFLHIFVRSTPIVVWSQYHVLWIVHNCTCWAATGWATQAQLCQHHRLASDELSCDVMKVRMSFTYNRCAFAPA